MTHPTRWRGRGSYTFPVLFSPYTGEPRDARDIASDPQGLLIVQPGAPLVPAAPTPPAQQDDEALEVLRELVEARDAFNAASEALQLQETSLRLRRATVEARALLTKRGAA